MHFTSFSHENAIKYLSNLPHQLPLVTSPVLNNEVSFVSVIETTPLNKRNTSAEAHIENSIHGIESPFNQRNPSSLKKLFGLEEVLLK